MLHGKAVKLIRLLYETQPMTARQIAGRLDCSIRTVKTYVHDINAAYPGSITSDNSGYHLDAQKAQTIFQGSSSYIPQSSQERSNYILIRLLLDTQGAAQNQYDLCEDLFVSLSTLKNDLQKVRRKVQQYDLALNLKGDTVSISGLEKNKRRLISQILYDESSVNFISIESLERSFKNLNIQLIHDLLLEVFNAHQYYINDYSLMNLILHLAITISRLQSNIELPCDQVMPGIRLKEYDIARELVVRLEENFGIRFSSSEEYELMLLIASRASGLHYESITNDNLAEFIGTDCLELVDYLIQDIGEYFYIDLTECEFRVRFALHIRNLLIRAKNGYFSKNPLTIGIKASCPLIYDVSVHLAGILNEKADILINEDEITYIAFHLGSTIEAQKNLDEKIKAVLYSPSYYDFNQQIKNQLTEHFADSLLITQIVTSEEAMHKAGPADLLLTTVPVTKVYSMPVARINPFLSKENRRMLEKTIQQIRKSRRQKKLETSLSQLMTEDLFCISTIPMSQEEVLKVMCGRLEELGYVDGHFLTEVQERESLSTTAFGEIAIPHSMKMNAQKTGISILISKRPIDWSGVPVNLVVMLCFNKEERYLFNEIFESIANVVTDHENCVLLAQAKTYLAFMETLLSLQP